MPRGITAAVIVTMWVLAACAGPTAGPGGAADRMALAETTSPPAQVIVAASGVSWVLPAAVCSDPGAGTGNPASAAALAAATELIGVVESADPGEPPGSVWFVAVGRLGPTALALAMVGGTTDAVLTVWSNAADPEVAGAIARRLDGWHTTAIDIVASLPEACG